jgi:FkbM family methyltransferase
VIDIMGGIRWRWRLLRRYAFLLRTFRNGWSLVQALRRDLPLDRAVLRDGTCLLHPPGRQGLVNTILEIWYDRAYSPDGFYRPADGDVIIDAGANVGLFTVWLARQNPLCHIVAVEPFPENFCLLQENLRASGVGNALALQIALGAGAGFGRMRDGGERSLDHRLVVEDDPSDVASRVPVASLAELFDRANAARIAFLKVDIEGAEHAVFTHAEGPTLSRIDRFAIEYHDHLSPGTSVLLRQRFEQTHRLQFRPEGDGRYGIVLGERRP